MNFVDGRLERGRRPGVRRRRAPPAAGRLRVRGAAASRAGRSRWACGPSISPSASGGQGGRLHGRPRRADGCRQPRLVPRRRPDRSRSAPAGERLPGAGRAPVARHRPHAASPCSPPRAAPATASRLRPSRQSPAWTRCPGSLDPALLPARLRRPRPPARCRWRSSGFRRRDHRRPDGRRRGTRAMLDARGLHGPHGPCLPGRLRDAPGLGAEQARTVGIEQLFMPALPRTDRPMDADGWRAVGAELGRMAQRMQEQGLALGYHNHHWELQTLPDGSLPLELLFEGAEDRPELRGRPRLAGARRRRSGGLARLVPRPAGRGPRQGHRTRGRERGRGRLERHRRRHARLAQLWRRALAHGAWMVLEHDKPNDPPRFARRGREFLLQLPA